MQAYSLDLRERAAGLPTATVPTFEPQEAGFLASLDSTKETLERPLGLGRFI